MRLGLDEHYSVEISVQLRAIGHDVCAVKERPELCGLGDPEIWVAMQTESRTLLTENVPDFEPIRHAADSIGEKHYGAIYTSNRSMPRTTATIGLYVVRLGEVLNAYPGDEDFVRRVMWLQPDPSAWR